MAEHSGTNTLAFGHAQLAKAVVNRIQRHFRTDATRRSAVEQSLVVGVFGEWGSGKSSLLHAVKQDFDAQPDEAAPVVTVFFNAWRYEKEPHLIVPLLKVVEAAIKRKAAESSQDASSPVWTRLKGTLVKGIKLFRSAALAFASTYEGTVTFKPPGEKEYALKISPKDAIEIFYASQDRNTPPSETPDLAHYAKLDEYDTLYLEFERQLRELTDSEPALNLLFFIDDLDRCLPEKALEMLEAIKLFFDVPRCVFVLAVDDEVVERGVQHRYRDYLFEASKAASADTSHRLPITGAEYLEKIIHLPLRLPPAQTGQAEQFLRERYPELFDYQATYREHQALAPKVMEEKHEAARQHQKLAHQHAMPEDHDEQQSEEMETATTGQAKQLLRHAQQQRDLCQLFARAVPPVPRKLQRAAELLHMLLDASQQLGLGIDQQPSKTLLLARLAIWQCFAPELFRLCRRQPSRFLRIAQWFADGQHDFGVIDAEGDKTIQKAIYGESQGDALAELRNLRSHVAASRRQRSEFDLKLLFNAYPSDLIRSEDMAKLQKGEALTVPAWSDPNLPGQLAQMATDIPVDEYILQNHNIKSIEHDEVIYGQVENIEDFLNMLFSNNPADQQDALHNSLQGGALPLLVLNKAINDLRFEQQSYSWLGQLIEFLAKKDAYKLPPLLLLIKKEDSENLLSCIFSPDGKSFITTSKDNTAKSWNTSTGTLQRVFRGHTNLVNSCAFSPDGKTIITASQDQTAKLWDINTGVVLHSFELHTASVLDCAFSPDGLNVFTASRDRTAKQWSTATGQLLHSFEEHLDPVNSCALSPDNMLLLTGSTDKKIRLWNTSSGELLHTFDGHTRFVTSCAFSPSNNKILTASGDKTAKLWNINKKTLTYTFAGHSNHVLECSFSPDGNRAITASRDHTVKLWDIHTGDLLNTIYGHTGPVRSCAFSPDGQHILTASDDSTARLWNASTGELIRTYFASQADNLALSWPARLQDFQGRHCTLRAIDPSHPITLPRNWILQDQRLAERQPVRTWPLEVLISRYGDDASQAVLASAHTAPSALPAQPTESA